MSPLPYGGSGLLPALFQGQQAARLLEQAPGRVDHRVPARGCGQRDVAPALLTPATNWKALRARPGARRRSRAGQVPWDRSGCVDKEYSGAGIAVDQLYQARQRRCGWLVERLCEKRAHPEGDVPTVYCQAVVRSKREESPGGAAGRGAWHGIVSGSICGPAQWGVAGRTSCLQGDEARRDEW